jgi:hypothetical protein
MLTKIKGKEKTLKIKGVEFNERQIRPWRLMVARGVSMLERVTGVKLKDFKTKNDPASASLANTGALQGPLQSNATLGGAFSAPGIRPQRFSAVQRPRSFARLLKPRMSEWATEKLGVMTAATDGSGANAIGLLRQPAVTPGDLLTCDQLFTFRGLVRKDRAEQRSADRPAAQPRRSARSDSQCARSKIP